MFLNSYPLNVGRGREGGRESTMGCPWPVTCYSVQVFIKTSNKI